MPPRIPWMISSPMRRKKTPAMAVSLSLELEGKEGQQRAGPRYGPPLHMGCSPSRNMFFTSPGDRVESGLLVPFPRLPIIHQYLLHS